MKAFFISSRINNNLQKVYTQIIKELKTSGVTVDESLIKRTSDQDAQDVELAFKLNMRSIKNADVIIAEVTELSSGIGFLIATALNEKKPVIALHNSEINSKQSKMLKGAQNKLLHFYTYTPESLSETIAKAVSLAKQKLDTKFILIIPAEIDRYLEWASKEKRMHKAQLVREAIDSIIVDDEEYQQYLNSL